MPDLDPGQWIFLLIALPIAVSGAVAWIDSLCHDQSRTKPLSGLHWMDRAQQVKDPPRIDDDITDIERPTHN